MRKPDRLKIVNMYPKNSSGYKKKDEVVTAAMKLIKSKVTENYFIALTMMDDGWEYRTTRIIKEIGLTEAQVSKAKKECIRLGLITIDKSMLTLKINYSNLSSDLYRNPTVNKNITHKEKETQSNFDKTFADENGEFRYPDFMGGDLIK